MIITSDLNVRSSSIVNSIWFMYSQSGWMKIMLIAFHLQFPNVCEHEKNFIQLKIYMKTQFLCCSHFYLIFEVLWIFVRQFLQCKYLNVGFSVRILALREDKKWKLLAIPKINFCVTSINFFPKNLTFQFKQNCMPPKIIKMTLVVTKKGGNFHPFSNIYVKWHVKCGKQWLIFNKLITIQPEN